MSIVDFFYPRAIPAALIVLITAFAFLRVAPW